MYHIRYNSMTVDEFKEELNLEKITTQQVKQAIAHISCKKMYSFTVNAEEAISTFIDDSDLLEILIPLYYKELKEWFFELYGVENG